MIETFEIKKTAEKVTLKVTLSLRTCTKDPKSCFTIFDAISLLEENGYKNKLGSSLNFVLLSNVSERKRIGEFSFLFKTKEKTVEPLGKILKEGFKEALSKVEESLPEIKKKKTSKKKEE